MHRAACNCKKHDRTGSISAFSDYIKDTSTAELVYDFTAGELSV